MALKVIDISYYNTITNWQSVKTACDAAIIRLGYRGCTSGKIVYDEMFKTFLDACKKYGIPYGEQIVATLTALDTLIGAVVVIANKQYQDTAK